MASSGGNQAQRLAAWSHTGAHHVHQVAHITAALNISCRAVLIAVDHLSKESVLGLTSGAVGSGGAGTQLKWLPVDLGGRHADAASFGIKVAEQVLELGE